MAIASPNLARFAFEQMYAVEVDPQRRVFDYHFSEVEQAQSLFESFRRHAYRVSLATPGREWPRVTGDLLDSLRRNTHGFRSDLRDAMFAEARRMLAAMSPEGCESPGLSAHRAALELLRRVLDARQASQFERLGWFTLRGSLRGLYRVHVGSVFNIERLSPDGRPVLRLCAVPDPDHLVPVHDILVAQVMWLRADEQEFLYRANRAGPVLAEPMTPVPRCELPD